MLKPERLRKGDKIAIISLSRGLLGEDFMAHQRKLIEERLHSFGLEVVYTPHALAGLEFLEKNPEKKAEDLKWAFADKSIKAILCTIGGEDTYRTIPYLLGDEEFARLVADNPKVFIGYSDSSINHATLYKLGLQTFYGFSAIVDFGELGNEMLPYSKEWFSRLFEPTEKTEIISSPVWYMERTDFSAEALGTSRIRNPETKGIEILAGSGKVQGRLFGGCIETLGELLLGDRYSDEKEIEERYQVFPKSEDLKDSIIFLETSEEKATPERLKELLNALDKRGAFEAAKGFLIGKPQDEAYYEEYKEVIAEVIGQYNKPIFYNLNFGHAHPHCLLPYGALVELDCETKKVVICEELVS